MRGVAAEALDGTAVIQTEQFVSDGGGGGTATWVSAGTVACRIAPYTQSSAGESLEGGQVMNDAEVIVTMPAETAVESNARIICGGRTYTAVAIRRRSQELTRRFAAKEIK